MQKNSHNTLQPYIILNNCAAALDFTRKHSAQPRACECRARTAASAMRKSKLATQP
jgi:uncharacterized glyoxalase superfamily protein PhnB